MTGLTRIVIGALGGFAAWISKLLALDATTLDKLFQLGLWQEVADLRVSIFIVLPALIFLGSVIAWLTEENLRIKLFAIGVSAPAIIAPWTTQSQLPDLTLLDRVNIVQPAFAQGADTKQNRSVLQGVQILLGIKELPDPKEEKYWVIVGSHADLDEAMAEARAINAKAPQLQAFVGNRAPGNALYPIIVGGADGYLPFDDARKLERTAAKVGVVKSGSYISGFADRFPASGVPR